MAKVIITRNTMIPCDPTKRNGVTITAKPVNIGDEVEVSGAALKYGLRKGRMLLLTGKDGLGDAGQEFKEAFAAKEAAAKKASK